MKLIPWIPFILPIVLLVNYDEELLLTKYGTIAWILSLLQCIAISGISYVLFGEKGLAFGVFWLMLIWYLLEGNRK
jgi:hypothetical protein